MSFERAMSWYLLSWLCRFCALPVATAQGGGWVVSFNTLLRGLLCRSTSPTSPELAKHLAITRYIFIQIHVHARVILNMFYTSFNTLLYLYQLYAITSFYLHFLFLSTQNWMSNSRSKNTWAIADQNHSKRFII